MKENIIIKKNVLVKMIAPKITNWKEEIIISLAYVILKENMNLIMSVMKNVQKDLN